MKKKKVLMVIAFIVVWIGLTACVLIAMGIEEEPTLNQNCLNTIVNAYCQKHFGSSGGVHRGQAGFNCGRTPESYYFTQDELDSCMN